MKIEWATMPKEYYGKVILASGKEMAIHESKAMSEIIISITEETDADKAEAMALWLHVLADRTIEIAAELRDIRQRCAEAITNGVSLAELMDEFEKGVSH